MSARPPIDPGVAAALTSQLPARLVKKLDAEPTLAEAWAWTATTVTTDKGEVVTLTLTDGVVRAVTCTCLLAPRCLHVAAVIARLPIDDAIPLAAVAEAAPAVVSPVDEGLAPVAGRAVRVLADLLAAGGESAGAFAQAELMRAIHSCRAAGLHRLAAAQTRVLRSVRELRDDKATFALATLAADLREALAVAHALAAGDATLAVIGTARRDYATIGSLKLRGVFTEAVIARSGYAGAVTYLLGENGTLYTRSDIAPGDAARAAGAYEAPAGLGDAVLPHRELGRAVLFASGATASADGRLGAGQQVQAVRAQETSTWEHPALAARWAEPLPTQLARIAERAGVTEELRPAGWDLVFVEGTIFGAPGTVVLLVDETPVTLVTSFDDAALVARDNLRSLARATSLAVRVIGRVRLGQARRLEVLALAPAADESRLPMLAAWQGRVNLHYDRLTLPSLGGPAAVATSAPPPDVLDALQRRIERVVLGGVQTLPTHAIVDLDREAAMLADRALHGGAEVLRDLAAFAHDATRSATGTRRHVDREGFARAWLRAALYAEAARRRFAVASWAR